MRTFAVGAHRTLFRARRVEKVPARRVAADLEHNLAAVQILIPLLRVKLAQSAFELLDLDRLLEFVTDGVDFSCF